MTKVGSALCLTVLWSCCVGQAYGGACPDAVCNQPGQDHVANLMVPEKPATKVKWRTFAATETDLSKAPRRHFKITEKDSVSLEVPVGWEAAEGVFGINVMLQRVDTEGETPTVAITHLGESPAIELADPRSQEKDYRVGREAWLAEKGGKFLQLVPLHDVSLNGAKGFTVGYRYSLNGEEFLENTYYVVCNGHAYNIKSVSPAALDKESAGEVDKLVSSFGCP